MMPATSLAPPRPVGAPPRPATPEKRTPNPAASAAFKATLAERHLKLGLEAQRVGNAAEATRNLESAARLAPDDERIARALKNVKQHFGDVEDTEEESSVRAAADVMRKRNAERYYLRGLKARRMDMWDEAIACFEGAVRTDPKNPDYAQALKEAHEKRTASAPEPRKKRGAAEVVGPSLKDQLLANSRFAVGVAAILALGILVTAWRALTPDSTDTELALLQEFGIFESIEEVEGVGWRANVDEPLLELDTKERTRRCRELAAALPGGGSLFLTSTEDGTSVMCRAD